MSEYTGLKLSMPTETLNIQFSTVNSLGFDGVCQYSTLKYRSGTKSILIFNKGQYEVLCGISSVGIKTIEVYCWSYTIGKAVLEIWSLDGQTLLGSSVNTNVELWEQLLVTFTASSIGLYRIRLKNLQTDGKAIYFDDLSLL